MLLVDIGNSRIKGAISTRGELSALPTLSTSRGKFSGWQDAISAQTELDRILVSNVAGEHVARKFTEFAAQCSAGEPEFIQPRRDCAGMSTLYDDPSQLGVDRWLAALGAYRENHNAVCVVDAGTAITVDIVDDAGRHLGGAIAPGLELMRTGLMSGTAQLEADALHPIEGFATNTLDAISLGCRSAAAGLLKIVVEHLSRQHPDQTFDWYSTGGGAPSLRNFVPPECVYAPDLVLRGLLRFAEDG